MGLTKFLATPQRKFSDPQSQIPQPQAAFAIAQRKPYVQKNEQSNAAQFYHEWLSAELVQKYWRNSYGPIRW